MSNFSGQTKHEAVVSMARYVEGAPLRDAIIAVGNIPSHIEHEVSLLSAILIEVNTIREIGNDRELANINRLVVPLPIPFSWNGWTERKQWTKWLLDTFDAMNPDIGPIYHGPKDATNPADIFRFYMFDVYGRYVATTSFEERNGERDRDYSDIVVNAMCEAAIILAEGNDPNARELVIWYDKQEWITTKWGITPSMCERAKAFTAR